MVPLIRRYMYILRRLIKACAVCQLPYWGLQTDGLNEQYRFVVTLLNHLGKLQGGVAKKNLDFRQSAIC